MNTNRFRLGRILFHAFLPVACGVVIYALWRGVGIFGMPALLITRPPDWVIFNLPDGLWIYAFLSTIFFIWEKDTSKVFMIWIALALSISFLLEVLQALHFTPGTFDWKDLIAYALGITAFAFNFQKSFKFSEQ